MDWYLSKDLQGNESDKSEQNLIEIVYYKYLFTPIRNSESQVRTRTLPAGTSRLIPKRNRLKFQTLKCIILLSPHQNALIKLPSWVLVGVYNKTIRRTLKWFILAKIRQTLAFVSLKYITYTQPIWVTLSMSNYAYCYIYTVYC